MKPSIKQMHLSPFTSAVAAAWGMLHLSISNRPTSKRQNLSSHKSLIFYSSRCCNREIIIALRSMKCYILPQLSTSPDISLNYLHIIRIAFLISYTWRTMTKKMKTFLLFHLQILKCWSYVRLLWLDDKKKREMRLTIDFVNMLSSISLLMNTCVLKHHSFIMFIIF